jgi:GTP cyclohydrolase III
MVNSDVYSIIEEVNIVEEGGLDLFIGGDNVVTQICQFFAICSRNLKRGGVTL